VAEEEEQKRRQALAKLASWSPKTGEKTQPGTGPSESTENAESKTVSFLDKKAESEAAMASPTMDRKIKLNRWPLRRVLTYGAASLFARAVLYELIFGDHSSKLNVQVERITISTVERGPFQEFIPVRGEVLPIQTIFLDAQESGRVEEVYLEAGAMVDKGDPILKLSNPDLEIKVMDQEASFFEQLNRYEDTRINLASQAINLQRNLLLTEQNVRRERDSFELKKAQYELGLISRRGYEAARDDYGFWLKRRDFATQSAHQDSLSRASQLAGIETAEKRLKANLEAARRSLDNLTLRAPVTGQLTSLNAEIGEQKSKGQRFGQVDVLDGFKVQAGIDEFYITRISRGQTATFPLGGEEYGLTIRRVYPEVREGRFNVDLEFSGEEPKDIRRGQTLPIRLALGDLSEALLLERGGFYQSTGGNWVFVVDEGGDTASRRPIRTGRQSPEFFEILEGLNPGDQVVTSSYENYEEIERLVLKR
jgi:HlyD family secretion protein